MICARRENPPKATTDTVIRSTPAVLSYDGDIGALSLERKTIQSGRPGFAFCGRGRVLWHTGLPK
jgi:hypothetical protein